MRRGQRLRVLPLVVARRLAVRDRERVHAAETPCNAGGDDARVDAPAQVGADRHVRTEAQVDGLVHRGADGLALRGEVRGHIPPPRRVRVPVALLARLERVEVDGHAVGVRDLADALEHRAPRRLRDRERAAEADRDPLPRHPRVAEECLRLRREEQAPGQTRPVEGLQAEAVSHEEHLPAPLVEKGECELAAEVREEPVAVEGMEREDDFRVAPRAELPPSAT